MSSFAHKEDKSFQTLIMSLGLHGLLVLLAYWNWTGRSVPAPVTAVEIVYKEVPETSTTQRKTVVRDPEAGEVLEELRKEVDRLSKLNRRVKEEMVAKKSGITQNRQPSPGAPTAEIQASRPGGKRPQDQRVPHKKSLAPNPKDRLMARDFDFRVDDLSLKHSPEQGLSLGAGALSKSLHSGESTMMDLLPNVKTGGFTALNTNQFAYYSFFARVNEQIYGRWKQNLRLWIPVIPIQQLRMIGGNELVTRIEVVFDRDGYYISHTVSRSSGQIPLDQAVVNAFVQAAPFLNPPQGLVESDGRVRLNYEFHVILTPSLLANK